MKTPDPKAEAASEAVRSFTIDGRETTTTTYRTRIIESFVEVAGKRFLDVGAADAYESRALSFRGAETVAIEGKDSLYSQAVKAAEESGVENHVVLREDIRRVDELGLGRFDGVLCFGVLYHMANPFNLLKRLAAVSADLLLLETHVAPEPWAENLLLPKHAGALMGGVRTLYLDGRRFEGRVCLHQGRHSHSKGSLDARWTFWLTQASLIKALTLAGYAVEAWFHELDDGAPPAVAQYGKALGFGHANTKVFVVARVHGPGRVEAGPGTVSAEPSRIVAPDFNPSMIDRLSKLRAKARSRIRRPVA